MAAIQYPATLPAPVRSGFAYRYGVAAKRLGMDDGGMRPVREWGAQPREFSLTFVYTWEEFASFEGWFAYDTKSGALNAIIPIKEGGSEEVEFKSDPDYRYDTNKGSWTVSIKVQAIMAAPVVPPTPAELPVWPTTLPEPEQGDYGYKNTGATHTNVGQGAQRSRLRFQRRRSDVNVRFILTQEELPVFENFVHNDLVGSLGWFKMPIASSVGVSLVRVAFAEITTEPLGSIYQITAAVETYDMPKLSEIQYRYPDGVKLNEVLWLKEFYSREFKGHVEATEEIWFLERFARTLDLFETLTLNEVVAKQIGAYVARETVGYIEALRKAMSLGNVAEAVKIAEEFKLVARKIFAEIVKLSESTTKIVSYNRGYEDLVHLLEELAHTTGFVREVRDTLSFSERGEILAEIYAIDYFAEDYTTIRYIFAESWFSELISLVDVALEHASDFHREPIDTAKLDESAMVFKKDYSPNYFETDYNGTFFYLE